MKIGPLFKWFGSKWQSAKHYPAPLCRVIVEPFAGGAGYTLNHCDKPAVLWDTDPHLSALWPWLIQIATPALVRDIPVNLPTGTDIRALGLTPGQALLLKTWQRTNSVGDCWTVSPWGHLPGQWTANTRARVADQIGAIKHWVFAKPWGLLRTPDLTWFLDPPYKFNYRYWRGHPAFDYATLTDSVGAIPLQSQVIVCEAVGPRGETPNYLPFASSHSAVTSRRKATQSHHSRELLYTRAPL